MLRTFILIFFFVFATLANGQGLTNVQTLSGKTFVSSGQEYLKILNSSNLHSSINSYTDTASFFVRNDTLYIAQRYLQTDQTGTKWMERLYDYKIIKIASDTLTLKNNYRFDYKPDNWEDTLVFVNLERVKEPVTDFKFLKLEYASPWSGERIIAIDSLGRISFVDHPIQYSINNPIGDKNAKLRTLKGRLTQKEFARFKDLLSKSSPSRLPQERSCPMDGSRSDFEIQIGAKKIKSTGCELSWTQALLLNYLYEIDQNKGFLRAKERQTTHNNRLPKERLD